MSVLSRVALAAGLAAVLVGGAFAPAAQAGSAKGSKHTYTCSNRGGGPNHTVNCSGLITVNNVLNNTTVTVGDINVLTDNQLEDLEINLVNAADSTVNQNVALQLLKLEGAVVNTYVQGLDSALFTGRVTVCAMRFCV
ncbi:preprotein translocase subunit TatB [Streptomyces sp. ISL-10]|uniref:preprotein translocase subunit TatB n=1 Tax=Streptomyces sp. ISL-10 TaxID=2819172 RepID=UPI001BE8EEAA|nr:preprotein translocase subunit TatB [Streptomyces sp. ISL-10]MBT2370196.1 preprotein translocase subunit TatB [Streptomyces sp. ISL-10]